MQTRPTYPRQHCVAVQRMLPLHDTPRICRANVLLATRIALAVGTGSCARTGNETVEVVVDVVARRCRRLRAAVAVNQKRPINFYEKRPINRDQFLWEK